MNNILQGNVTDKLKEIESNTVQCVVTSPPYWGLRDYGSDGQLGLEETPEEYVENMVEVFREIKRVLKNDGTVWLNLGDTYLAQTGKGFPGTGQRNIPNSSKYAAKKIKRPKSLKPKNIIGIPWRVAFALQSDGWYLRQDIIWHKPNPMPESVKDRCTKSHEYIFLLTKSAKYYYNIDAIREPHQTNSVNKMRDRSTESYNNSYIKDRFSKGERPQGHENGRNKRSVWSINTKPYKEAHFAVFPPKLPELCIKAGSAKGDIILDPFFGSGTTGWVAQRLGRKWIGVELNPEYIKIANKRFQQQELFYAK
tara:strand:+ start:978 stop:1904 length:927 start_codon:yes stop_codon:yes gene_type:complete